MNWRSIRILGKVKYFNISYAVLLLVPFLVDLYSVLIQKKLGISEFPFKLKLLYASSLSYALGIALYQLFCPQKIRRFENEHDYVKAYYEIDKDLYLDQKLEIVLSNLADAQYQIRNEIQTLFEQFEKETIQTVKSNLKRELNEKLDLVYDGCVKRYLLNEYNKSNSSNSWAIYPAAIFYGIGTISLLWLLFEKSIKVLTTN